MPEKLICSNGHAWESDVARSACPVCGSAADSLGAADSSTWDNGIADELPPPPGACPRELVSEPSDIVPAVPGYEIVGELGRGGMGVVYEARHTALNRRVALKVIRGFAGREEVARFRGEAEAVARLQHPNIVQIYEVGEHAGLPYLALELVSGGNLAACLRRSPLAARPAAVLVAILARGVQHAHSRGVVHRDLKPANILLQDDLSTPKVSDFGLAKIADDPGRSRSGLVVGSPAYMAPEQASGRGDLVGPPADVWALGTVLYECLTRRPPLIGPTSVETVQQVLTAEPTPPARVVPGVPRDLDTICLKCLRKEPEQRYRTAGDLADDLARFLEGRPILARRAPWWEKVGKWARRRPAAAGLIVVTLGAGSALAGLGYRYFHNLEKYNADLEAKNATISKSNNELEERNTTITKRTRDLELANASTIKERDRAESNLAGTLEAVDGLLSMTGIDRLAQAPHIDRTRAAMLERALQVCDRLVAGQEGNPRLLLFKGLTLQRAGRILTLLQRYKEAEERLDRALAVLQEHRREARADTPIESFVRLEALTRLDRGKLFLRTGRPDDARKEYASAHALLESPDTRLPDDGLKYLAAIGNADLAVLALDEDNADLAKLHLGRARQSLEELFAGGSKDVAFLAAYAFVLNGLGVAYMKEGETDHAAELFERAIRVSNQVLITLPTNVNYRAELARYLANLGVTFRVRGYYKRAAVSQAEARDTREELARDHPDIGTLSLDLCSSYRQTGQIEHSRDDFRAADDWFTKAVDRLTKDTGLLAQEPHARSLLAEVYQARAASREQLKRFTEAAEDMTKALGFVPPDKRPSLRVQRAGLLVSAGQIANAIKEVESVLLKPDELSAEVPFDVGVVFVRAAKQTDNPERREEFSRRAVQAFALAAECEYFHDPKRRTLLDDHPGLKHLHGREDFDALRARVSRR